MFAIELLFQPALLLHQVEFQQMNFASLHSWLEKQNKFGLLTSPRLTRWQIVPTVEPFDLALLRFWK
jgi:hypothetical protein